MNLTRSGILLYLFFCCIYFSELAKYKKNITGSLGLALLNCIPLLLWYWKHQIHIQFFNYWMRIVCTVVPLLMILYIAPSLYFGNCSCLIFKITVSVSFPEKKTPDLVEDKKPSGRPLKLWTIDLCHFVIVRLIAWLVACHCVSSSLSTLENNYYFLFCYNFSLLHIIYCMYIYFFQKKISWTGWEPDALLHLRCLGHLSAQRLGVVGNPPSLAIKPGVYII